MAVAESCLHCPDGHEPPSRTPWAVWVGTERDGDGQPVMLHVAPTAGAHVAEADAEWLRGLIRAWARQRHGWGECRGCGAIHPLNRDGAVRPHVSGPDECNGSREYPHREVNHA